MNIKFTKGTENASEIELLFEKYENDTERLLEEIDKFLESLDDDESGTD